MKFCGFFVLLFLTSCSLYKKPQVVVPVDVPESYQNTDFPSSSRVDWLAAFNSAQLNNYLKIIAKNNKELDAAAARLQQAYARYEIAKGGLFPTLGAGVQASRSANVFQFGTQINRQYINIAQATLNSQWEIDLFARLQNTTKAAAVQALASEYDLAALKQALSAEFTRQYIIAATQIERIAVTENIIKSRQRALKVVDLRYRSGLSDTSAADVHAARANLYTIESQQENFQQQLKSTYYNMALLLGQSPQAVTTEFALEAVPDAMPVNLPAAVLDKRPDLQADAFRIMAAEYDVKVAVANLYPSLILSGDVGFQADDFGQLFDADQLITSIVASLTARLFEGGRLRANIKLQKAVVEELINNYAQNILAALNEVETALLNENTARTQLQTSNKILISTRHREEITLKRYQQGITDFLNVLSAQEQRFDAEQQRLNNLSELWLGRVNIYSALGMTGSYTEKSPEKNF